MLFDFDNPRNTVLQIKVIFNIGRTIYIYIYIYIKYFSFDFYFWKAFNEISWQDSNHLLLSLFEKWDIWSFV